MFIRAFTMLASLGVLGFTVASPISAQEEPKAEKVFASIKSFQGQDAKEIMPAMHAMTQALGTDCSFCHKETDFAAEGMEHKDIARSMIAMTKEINEKHFGGKPEVTCFTCHGGRTHPRGVASAMPVRSSIQADPKLDAAKILAKLTPGSLPKDAVVSLEGDVTTNQKPTGTVTVHQAFDGRFYESQKGEKGHTLGFDGTTSWYDGGAGKQPIPAPMDDAMRRYGAFFWAGSFALESLSAGTEKLNGTEVTVLRGKQPGRPGTVKLYIDPKSGVVRRVIYFDRSIVGPFTEIYDYDEYKTVNGIMIPMKVTQHTSPEKASVRTYKKAVITKTEALKEFQKVTAEGA